jgi:hypothetical protein
MKYQFVGPMFVRKENTVLSYGRSLLLPNYAPQPTAVCVREFLSSNLGNDTGYPD